MAQQDGVRETFAAVIDRLDSFARARLLPNGAATSQELERISDRGPEDPPAEAGTTTEAVEALWERVLDLYRSGVHPAIQICVRRHGAVAIDRAIGFARGGGPHDPIDGPPVRVTTRTPINLFSAAKAVTAMVVHKLDEQRVLHLDDRVSEYIPGFARHGKQRITIRHLVSHRAGIPSLPREALDLDLLADPDRVIEMICDLRPTTPPGRLLAYHAVSSGFVLAEVVRRAAGESLREVLAREIREPLGLEWLHFGVAPEDEPLVARNAATGPRMPPPISLILRNALGTDLPEIVELSNDPRFLTGIIPSGNVISTARDSATLYQCLLHEGEYEGRRVFAPRTVHHAVDEQSGYEIDLTLLLPIVYSNGFMLGTRLLSPYGWNHPEAFGHLGLSNVFCWADPERDVAVAILTTGKPILGPHAVSIVRMMTALHRAFPRVQRH